MSAPNGRFASGAGIEVQDGEAFTVTNSVVSNNTASLTSSYPSGVDSFADSGGIHIGGLGSATIQGSRITGNTLSASDAVGSTGAGSAGLGVGFSDFCVCGQTLVLKDSVVSGNRVTVVGGDGSFAGNAMEIDSPAINNTAVIGNSISVTGQSGAATAARRRVRLRRRVPAGRHEEHADQRQHRARVVAAPGPRPLQGAGLINGGLLELHTTSGREQHGSATGTSGFAEGGGIWNGQPFGPDGRRRRASSGPRDRDRQLAAASPGLPVQGGGVFTSGFPISRHSLIVRNTPISASAAEPSATVNQGAPRPRPPRSDRPEVPSRPITNSPPPMASDTKCGNTTCGNIRGRAPRARARTAASWSGHGWGTAGSLSAEPPRTPWVAVFQVQFTSGDDTGPLVDSTRYRSNIATSMSRMRG